MRSMMSTLKGWSMAVKNDLAWSRGITSRVKGTRRPAFCFMRFSMRPRSSSVKWRPSGRRKL